MKILDLVKTATVIFLITTGAVQAANRWETIPEPAPMPAADASGYVANDDEKVYFETHGTSGPWIIFLHGGTGSALSFGNQVPAFAGHNRVLLIEMRGHGRSTWNGEPLTYEKMADGVVRVMDALGIAKASIVGWSDGGDVAFIIAADHPDRVEKFVTSGSNVEPEGLDTSVYDKPPYNTPSKRSENAYKALSATPEKWETFRDGIYKMWENEPHLTAKLKLIKAPALIMVGDHDVIKAEHTKMIVDSIAGARTVVVPDTAHYVLLQDPDNFNRIVKEFLGVE